MHDARHDDRLIDHVDAVPLNAGPGRGIRQGCPAVHANGDNCLKIRGSRYR